MSKYLIENLFGIEGWNIAWYSVIIAVGIYFSRILQSRAIKKSFGADAPKDFLLRQDHFPEKLRPVKVWCGRLHGVPREKVRPRRFVAAFVAVGAERNAGTQHEIRIENAQK